MKLIGEMLNLEGKLEVISLTDFRTRPGEVMEQVALGKTYVIERYGKEVGVLSRVPGTQLAMHVARDGRVTHRL